MNRNPLNLKKIIFSLLIIMALTVIHRIIFNNLYLTGLNILYSNCVSLAFSISNPNVEIRDVSYGVQFFSLRITGNIYKKLACETKKIGSFSIPFFLNSAGELKLKMESAEAFQNFFFYPSQNENENEWEKLSKLSTKKITECYISFDRFFSSKEVVEIFGRENINIDWFAVDCLTAMRCSDINGKKMNSIRAIGFPNNIINTIVWNDNTIRYKKSFTISLFKPMTISEKVGVKKINGYNDYEQLETNFLKILIFLKTNKVVIAGFTKEINLDKEVEYIRSKGIRIYGVTVTASVEKLLKLKNNPYIKSIKLGGISN